MTIYFDPEKDAVQHRGIGIPVTYSQGGHIFDSGKNYKCKDKKWEDKQKQLEADRQKELGAKYLKEAQSKLVKKTPRNKGQDTNNQAKGILDAMKASPSNPTNVANASARENAAAQIAEDSDL
jgi:hypothetical protein